MEFRQDDQIQFEEKKVYHRSAGGFLFYEEPRSHRLYIALIKPENEEKLFIPKGHLKLQETPREAAEREISEELSLKNKPHLITELGTDSYSFTLDDSGVVHFKEVYLFVFESATKEQLKAPEEEKISESLWVDFYDALKEMAYDRNNLLKARQLFYSHKPVKELDKAENKRSISICIPTYNGQKTIRDTLESAALSLDQLGGQIQKEIIVCFDHCSDNTQKVADSFKKESEDKTDIIIKLIDNTGQKGKSSAMNAAFERTNSEILCFIDDDVRLDRSCLGLLLKELVKNKNVSIVYPNLVRNKRKVNNIWQSFWQYVLEVKFDIQPYDKSSQLMGGACIMMKRENFVHMSAELINDDQFLQYMYWPATVQVQDAVANITNINSLCGYYKRYSRITNGMRQLLNEFTKGRLDQCNQELFRSIDYKRISKLPLKQKSAFYFYRFVRFLIKCVYKINSVFVGKKYGWSRT